MNQTQTETERWDLYMNGVYRSVLEEILAVHKHLPDQILYMQPHGSGQITKLRDDPPTIVKPTKMWISTGDDLQHVSYAVEIVGWEDKTEMSDERHQLIESIINLLQPEEGGLYDMVDEPGESSVNLLHVRRMFEFKEPFSVSRLVKISDGKPLSTNRTRGGGYSYVRMGRG